MILGAPTYFASLPGTMKAWLEMRAKGLGLAGKLGCAFATEQYIHGGGETAIGVFVNEKVSHLIMNF